METITVADWIQTLAAVVQGVAAAFVIYIAIHANRISKNVLLASALTDLRSIVDDESLNVLQKRARIDALSSAVFGNNDRHKAKVTCYAEALGLSRGS